MHERGIEPDRTVRAEFDYENATISLPLADYELSDEEWHVINTAMGIAYSSCMRSRGFAYLELGPFVHDESRLYGLWNVDRARSYGFGLAGDGLSAGTAADENADENMVMDPRWQQAFGVCEGELHDVLSTFVPPADHASSTGRIGQEAYNLAVADPAWARARRRWWACLRSRGLEADRRDGRWGSTRPAAIYAEHGSVPSDPAIREELVRIAVIEAECNVASGTARTLADLEAGYQAVLIHGNEVSLTAEKEAGRRYLEAARAYIAAQPPT